MKRSHLIGLGALLLLAVGLFLAALVLRGERSFDVQGRVAGFSQNGRTIFVEHEAIPGYMAAMTMPFAVHDTTALEGLEIGDAVGFRLHVTGERSWITDLSKLPDDAVARHPAGRVSKTEQVATASDSVQFLREGDRVPADLQLTSQAGEPITLGEYRGQALVLTFVYTRCPLPNFCPLMSKRFAALQPKVQEAFGDRAQLLSISFDPAYDTPEVLRAYAKRYDADFDTWTFATGSPEQIGRITSLFGVFTRKEGGQIIHNLTTALIGPDGDVREIWRGRDWTTEVVMQAVRHALSESAP